MPLLHNLQVASHNSPTSARFSTSKCNKTNTQSKTILNSMGKRWRTWLCLFDYYFVWLWP